MVKVKGQRLGQEGTNTEADGYCQVHCLPASQKLSSQQMPHTLKGAISYPVHNIVACQRGRVSIKPPNLQAVMRHSLLQTLNVYGLTNY